MENQDMRNPQPEMTDDVVKRVHQLSVETAHAQERAERALSEAGQARFEVETWRENLQGHGRSLKGLWVVSVVLVLALGGLGWYGYNTAQDMDSRFAALPDFGKSIQAVSDRVQAAEDKLATWATDWKSLGDRVSRVESRARSDYQLVRNFAREQANEVHRQLLTELDNRTDWLQTRMMRIDSTQEAQRARISQLEEELAGVRSEVAGVRSEMNGQIAQVRRDTGREMDGLHTRVAQNRSDLDALAWQLDRQRLTFEVIRNQARELLPGISLTLKDTNVSYQRVEEGWVHVIPDGRILWIRSQGIQQPMTFYTQGDSRPYQLVFTRLNRDGAVGYLVYPGGPPVAAGGHGPLAGEGELSASALGAR
jgi:hypothetical protein